MKPAIAVPLGLDAGGRLRPGRRTLYADDAVAAALAGAGALPFHASCAADPEAVAARCDGLLLPGGDDFIPEAPYPPQVRFVAVPEEQLAFDAALLAAALARGLPVLGICYGMQLLARHHGGALVYDIPSDRPEARAHQLEGPEARHELRVERGTLLHRLLGAERVAVNSRHHQGVAEPGTGLRVCARSEDALIEAVEGPGFVLGVQWHPEDLAAEHRDALFGGFVAACRGSSRS